MNIILISLILLSCTLSAINIIQLLKDKKTSKADELNLELSKENSKLRKMLFVEKLSEPKKPRGRPFGSKNKIFV